MIEKEQADTPRKRGSLYQTERKILWQVSRRLKFGKMLRGAL